MTCPISFTCFDIDPNGYIGTVLGKLCLAEDLKSMGLMLIKTMF